MHGLVPLSITLGSDAGPGSVEDTEEQYYSFGCEANLLRGALRSELKGQKVQLMV